MKKMLIGSIIGGLILFIWQFLSFALINFHEPAQQYTDKQEAIMTFLNSQGLEEGGYIMPMSPRTASSSEMEADMKNNDGKPWVKLDYHQEAENSTADMVTNMVRGLLVNIVIIWLFCWIMSKLEKPRFGTILASALVVGLISFLNQPYTGSIWYKFFDIWAYFFDALVSWGLVGLWLGWWLTRVTRSPLKVPFPEKEIQAV